MRFRLAIAACVSVALAMGQSTARRPQVEVAAIKANKSGDPGMSMGSPGPGRYLAENVTLRFLIQNAWNVREFQLVGIPDFIARERFDIQATMETGAPSNQLQAMMQSLLEERFRLKLHREKREQSIYSLLPVRNGIKIQALAEGACSAGAGQPSTKGCGNTSWGPAQVKGTGVSMTTFTEMLSAVMERSVVDNTGLKGLFDIALTWTPDDAFTPAAAGSGPSLFTAIQEQLGLRLESTKGQVEVLVVDSVERPSEN